jgi:hypothetical protein
LRCPITVDGPTALVRIEIDSEGRSQLREIESSDRRLDVEVDVGFAMSVP